MKKNSRVLSVVLGPLLFVVLLFVPIEDLSFQAKLTLGIAIWMAAWWVTEAIPIYQTAIIPLVLFPLLGILEIEKTILHYVDEIVLLFLGGFLIAKAIETSNLHRRFALNILKTFGTKPSHIIGGFIVVTASLSAWMTNTATALLILPIAVAVISQVKTSREKSRFGACLMLCVAYSATLGGLSTLIGTPPNAILASLAGRLASIDVSFGEWMLIGLPTSFIALVILWLYMIKAFHLGREEMVGTKDIIKENLKKLGRFSGEEKIVFAIFIGTAISWITRGLVWKEHLPFIEDYTIALIAAILLLLIPARSSKRRILDLRSASTIQWRILILIGGGLALAGGFMSTGLDVWISEQLGFVSGMDYVLIVVIVAAVTIFSGELMSNTAGAALLLPVMASLSSTIQVEPILLMVPVTLATSFNFVMPVGTPPNAIVIGSGHVGARQMAKFGLPLNIIGIATVTVMTVFLAPLIFT